MIECKSLATKTHGTFSTGPLSLPSCFGILRSIFLSSGKVASGNDFFEGWDISCSKLTTFQVAQVAGSKQQQEALRMQNTLLRVSYFQFSQFCFKLLRSNCESLLEKLLTASLDSELASLTKIRLESPTNTLVHVQRRHVSNGMELGNVDPAEGASFHDTTEFLRKNWERRKCLPSFPIPSCLTIGFLFQLKVGACEIAAVSHVRHTCSMQHQSSWVTLSPNRYLWLSVAKRRSTHQGLTILHVN